MITIYVAAATLLHRFDTHHVLARVSEPVQYGRNRKKAVFDAASTLMVRGFDSLTQRKT
jgi:hypothetical protein